MGQGHFGLNKRNGFAVIAEQPRIARGVSKAGGLLLVRDSAPARAGAFTM